MDYLKSAGGLVEEKKYEYLGADGYCKTKNFTSDDLVPFEVPFSLPLRDEDCAVQLCCLQMEACVLSQVA